LVAPAEISLMSFSYGPVRRLSPCTGEPEIRPPLPYGLSQFRIQKDSRK
jgi:hypothetical protein